MTALRLSSAYWVRAFGLIPSAGRGFYDNETTIERGYPLFHLFSDYCTPALQLARTCSFLQRRISVCINVRWGALQWTTSVLVLGGLGLRLLVI